MINNSKEFFLLFLIVLIFFVTRLFRLSEVPPTLYWDEASIGYNAYSISKDLKDEWGEFLPLHFRAFGEFKLPGYIYSVVPFVKLFGLSEFSVRFPAVLYSLGSVILTYLLVKKISEKNWVGILAAFFMTISPWFFIVSRVGYEATAGLFFFILATYLVLFINKNRFFIFWVTLAFILSFYSYNSFRIIVPIWISVLTFRLYKDLKKARNLIPVFIFSLVVFIFSLYPVWRLVRYDAGASRYRVVASETGDLVKNYLSHFSPSFLFVNGDPNPRSQQPGFGQLYFSEIILFLLGLWEVIKKRQHLWWMPVGMLLVGSIPASITHESPHALRSILMAPSFAILSAFGLRSLSEKFKHYKGVILTGVIILSVVFFENYFVNFFENYPRQTSKDWQYGYKELFTKYSNDFEKYDRVIISDEYGQPYIFALYYLKYNPEKFRGEARYNDVSNWGHSTVAHFDKFEFKKLGRQDVTRNSLVFSDKPIESLKSQDEVEFLDSSIAFYVYR